MGQLTPRILHFESLPSTNVEAARRASEGAPEGLCIVASEQTAGRGRLQRSWLSPRDAGLYFSIIIRPKFEQRLWPLITLMAAIAVHDALLEACALETDIKWPNDILANDKKLCGILSESVETPQGRGVIVGIGINLTTSSFPSELAAIATSVESSINKKPELEVVLKSLVRALASGYELVSNAGGPEAVIDRWCALSSYAEGKLICVNDGAEILSGTTRGLEPDGALRVETSTGEIRIVRAGDVTTLRPS